MPDWTLPDAAADPDRGDPLTLPDPDELRWMVDNLRLDTLRPADIDGVADELDAAQSHHFAPDGPLSRFAPSFRIDREVIRAVLASHEGDIDWHAWAGHHVGRVNDQANAQTWHPPQQRDPGLTLQIADFADDKHGYNITYADGLHAGYDRKTDRISGAHVGFGRRIGTRDLIVWLLPDETFLEVIGPETTQDTAIHRTAVSGNGSTWGRWRVHPARGRGTAV